MILRKHETFLLIFKCYMTNTALLRLKWKKQYLDKPWVTKGIQNACKKKKIIV